MPSSLEHLILSLNNIDRKEYMTDAKHAGVYIKRLQFFLDILGNPEKQIPHYIHVTGTSGKGSVCAFLASGLMSAGHKTGLLVSPHPSTLTERFEVNGVQMTQKEEQHIVPLVTSALRTYVRTSPYDMLSFFELITAIGLFHFAQKKITHAVIEVGCGGRYDSTNVIPHKDVAIITNIGLDHVGIIGNNKPEIAYEKSGIIKSGCAVYTMEKTKHIRNIIQKEAREVDAPYTYLHPTYTLIKQTPEQTTYQYKDETYKIPTASPTQINNAILATEALVHLDVTKTQIKQGLLHAVLPLRMEIIQKQPYVVLDGAHNEDKIASTVLSTNELLKRIKGHQVHLVFGLSRDKELKKIIPQLLTLPIGSIACTRNTVNAFRKVYNPHTIQTYVQKKYPNITTESFLDPTEAYDWSYAQTKKNDILLVTGSIFLSGELRAQLKG